MVIPRERGLVRLYIQLNEIKPDAASGRADRSKITPDVIFKAAQKIIAPYQLRYNYCDWWTAYQVCFVILPTPLLPLMLNHHPTRSANACRPPSLSTTASSSRATPCTRTRPRRAKA